MIRFTVPGTPVAKGRPRITTRGGFARAYTPGKTVAYEALIAEAGRAAMGDAKPYTGPVAVTLTAVFEIPKSWPKRKREAAYWHTSKPDKDNIEKALGDGLNGIVWADDSQIASTRSIKVYGAVAGLHVEVTAL